MLDDLSDPPLALLLADGTMRELDDFAHTLVTEGAGSSGGIIDMGLYRRDVAAYDRWAVEGVADHKLIIYDLQTEAPMKPMVWPKRKLVQLRQPGEEARFRRSSRNTGWNGKQNLRKLWAGGMWRRLGAFGQAPLRTHWRQKQPRMPPRPGDPATVQVGGSHRQQVNTKPQGAANPQVPPAGAERENL